MINFQEEYVKCFMDKTRKYFIEHYLSTYDATQRKTVPFVLFPRQVVFLNNLMNHDANIAIKPRQQGITTVTSGWITGEIVFASPQNPHVVLCIANKLDMSEDLLSKIVTFLDQVPRWMWGNEFYSPDPDSPKNAKSIYKKCNKSFVELYNGCKIHARSSGENAARGISAVSILVFDEAAFIEGGLDTYASATAATASVQHAKIVMVSTPNGKDALYYNTYNQARQGLNGYTISDFRWYQDPRYNKNLKWSRKNEETGDLEWEYDPVVDKKGNVVYNEERWKRLIAEGWKPTSEWYIRMCKQFNNDSQRIAQELDVSFLGSADNVIPSEVIEAQQAQNVVEITEDWPLKDNLIKDTWIWKDPIPGHRYICACLPEGEQVLTQRGLVNVEDVKYGDLLVTKEGKFTRIKRRKYRYVKNEEIYSMRFSNVYKPIKFTDEHPLWVSNNAVLNRSWSIFNDEYKKGEWHWDFDFKYEKAKDIKVGAWVAIPNFYYDKTISIEEMVSKWGDTTITNPLFDKDFWWFCGMWLAEGCYSGERIYTSHNVNEISIMNRIINIAHRLFNVSKVNKYDLKKCKATNLSFKYNYLGEWLTLNFGKYAYGKYISEWIKYIPYEFKKELLMGYIEGDGTITINKRDGKLIKIASVSYKLLEDVQDIFYSMGYTPSLVINMREKIAYIRGKKIHSRNSYELSLGHHETQKFLNEKTNRSKKRKGNCFLSKDKKTIFYKIKSIEKTLFTGKVYNFETEDESHSYCCRNVVSHNCDPSSGSGADATAIEILDIDAIDEVTGKPYIDQVLEYNGKMTGDEIGEMLFTYAQSYNNAMVVIESIGGYGDAAILTLMSMRYPNIYYDDPGLKTYTVQQDYKKFGHRSDGKLPGFRTNGVRMQMIQNFIALVKSNGFRIRSRRVIAEMDTWVWKNGRPDHMSGAFHDDTLTCLAMGIFVAQYSMIRTEKERIKDTYILRSWHINNGYGLTDDRNDEEKQKALMSEMPKKLNPFLTRQKHAEEQHLKSCLMLGGFGYKKR